jgi:hypothetical protein
MDITPTSTSMGPPSSGLDQGRTNGDVEHTSPNGNSSAPAVGAAAAAASQGPKVVQTAFIHKLYK